MKKGILLVLLSIAVLICIVAFLKPSAIEQNAQNGLQVQTTATPAQTVIDAEPNTENISVQADINSESSGGEQNQLADTKSDLSIQPIDPETDPGNQIAHPN